MIGTSGSSSNWQLALAVAAPVALGLGYMYYTMKPPSKPTRGKSKEASKKNGAPASDKQISIVNDCPPKPLSEAEALLGKAQRLKDEGNEQFKAGKYDKAIMLYNNAIEVCPEENTTELATFYQNRAAAYEQLKKYSAVKADCTKALELNPNYAKALIRRARASEYCNELEPALADLTVACALENNANETAVSMTNRVLYKLGREQAVKYMADRKLVMPSKYFVKSSIDAFHNDPVFTMLQNIDNSDMPLAFTNILECIREQKYDDVIPMCTEQFNSLDPDILSYKMEILLLRATFYFLLEQHDCAIEDFGIIINNDNATKAVKVNTLIKRAISYMRLKSRDKSDSDFEMAVKLDPDCGDIYYHRGQVNLFMENIDAAREDFKRAVELNSNFAMAYTQKCYADYCHGVMKENMKLITDALQDFEEVWERFPDCNECYPLYAQALLGVQEYQKADSYLAKVIDKDPNYAKVYVCRGILQLEWKGDADKAIEYINKALEVDDKCEYAYATLGAIEVERGNTAEAIKLFDKAVPLSHSLMDLTRNFISRNAAKMHLTIKDKLGINAMKGF